MNKLHYLILKSKKRIKTRSLFEKYNYFNYQFLEPQYLGAKYNFLQWFYHFIPKNIKTAMDVFSGSQSVAYFFKQRGLQIFTNDFLNFNH